jgi:hypothetical protein
MDLEALRMGSGRTVRVIGVIGATLSVALFWLTFLLPWGSGPDGVLNAVGFARQLGPAGGLPGMFFGCYRYLSGFGILFAVPVTVLTLTVGIRGPVSRFSAGVLGLASTLAVVVADTLTAVSTRGARGVVSGWYPSIAAEAVVYAVTIAASIVLMNGGWRFYGRFVVGLLILLAAVHAGSLADYLRQPHQPAHLGLFAWLPVIWYLGAATGAALAMLGSNSRAQRAAAAARQPALAH